MLNNFIDSLDNSSNTELSGILKQIDILSNDILVLKDSENDLKKKKHLLKNGSQWHK